MKPISCTGLEEYANRLHKEHELEFYFTLACVHFGAEQTNKALFWLNKVLNDPEPTLRQDIFTNARLFNLLVHYELGNFDLLQYIVRSTHRFLSKRHRARQVENLADRAASRNLARAQEPIGEARPVRWPCRDGLLVLMKDPNESVVLKYFDFLSWAESRWKGSALRSVVKRKARKA